MPFRRGRESGSVADIHEKCGSMPMTDNLPMTEQEILQQMDELQKSSMRYVREKLPSL